MSLGETIHRLRVQKGLTQNELAEQLGVSRQSVSKWETDGSIPELDMLLKLSQLFEISLDELVGNALPQQNAPTVPQDSAPESQKPFFPKRKIFACILYGLAGISLLLGLFIGPLLESVFIGVLLLLLGCIPMFCKRHPWLWFCWAVYFLADTYMRVMSGFSAGTLLSVAIAYRYIRVSGAMWISLILFLLLLVMTILTLWTDRRRRLELTSVRKRRLILGALLLAGLFALPALLNQYLLVWGVTPQQEITQVFLWLDIFSFCAGWVRHAVLICWLGVLLAVRRRKKEAAPQ